MTKYFCDNCGKEAPVKNLSHQYSPAPTVNLRGEVCDDCYDKVMDRVHPIRKAGEAHGLKLAQKEFPNLYQLTEA